MTMRTMTVTMRMMKIMMSVIKMQKNNFYPFFIASFWWKMSYYGKVRISRLLDFNPPGIFKKVPNLEYLENKAGNSVTQVACGWAGAVIKQTNKAFGHEQQCEMCQKRWNRIMVWTDGRANRPTDVRRTQRHVPGWDNIYEKSRLTIDDKMSDAFWQTCNMLKSFDWFYVKHVLFSQKNPQVLNKTELKWASPIAQRNSESYQYLSKAGFAVND